MPKYTLVTGVVFSDGVHPAGEVVTLSEENAQGYLERGSIKPFVEGEAAHEEVQHQDELSSTGQGQPDKPVVPTSSPTQEQIDEDLKTAGV